MRKLNRDKDFFGYTNGLMPKLEVLSRYCFVSDIKSIERKVYVLEGVEKYENAFLIDKALKEGLGQKRFDEKDVLFFRENLNLKHYFFFLNEERPNPIVDSLTKPGKANLEFIELTLGRRFADGVDEVVKDTKKRIFELLEEKQRVELEGLTEDKFIDFVKDYFFPFLKDMTTLPLIAVRATVVLDSNSFRDLKGFVCDNLSVTSDDRQEKIRSDLAKYEQTLANNGIFPKKYYLSDLVNEWLRGFKYQTALSEWKSASFSPEVNSLFKYVYNLFVNPIDCDVWEDDVELLSPINVKDTLKKGYETFKDVISDEKHYLEIKRILSKAQIHLMSSDYSNFTGDLQKFMEAYLKAIGAAEKRKGDKMIPINRIGDKMKLAFRLFEKSSNEVNKAILNSFDVCFDGSEDAKIKQINASYLPIKHLRNELFHGDKGQNEKTFKEKLKYLIEEELGKEEYTGHFLKYLGWFQMPNTNVFEQINKRIITILQKPDFVT